MFLELLLLAGFAILVGYNLRQLGGRKPVSHITEHHPPNPQIEQTLAYAARLYSEHKYLAAEKAYLAVLKHDHKNHVAYSRLGKIYIALKNYPDAIETLRIASQLSPNAHTYFNLGTGYYENRNYIKAVASFEKAIMFEPSAGRYTALARSHQKLSNWPKAAAALEKAVEMQPDAQHLQALYETYQQAKKPDDAARILRKLKELGSAPLPARRPHSLS